MADGISANFDELYGLVVDLTQLQNIIPKKAEQAIQQAAMKTKKFHAADAKKSMPSSIAGQYAPTIDYELRNFGAFGQTQYTADIGPNLGRYGGKTGKGGLIPSMGILDDPENSVLTPPSRSRRRAEKFAETELIKGAEIAIEQSMRAVGL